MSVVAVDFQDGLNRAWTGVITVVPKLIAAIVIVVVGLEELRIDLQLRAESLTFRAGALGRVE